MFSFSLIHFHKLLKKGKWDDKPIESMSRLLRTLLIRVNLAFPNSFEEDASNGKNCLLAVFFTILTMQIFFLCKCFFTFKQTLVYLNKFFLLTYYSIEKYY